MDPNRKGESRTGQLRTEGWYRGSPRRSPADRDLGNAVITPRDGEDMHPKVEKRTPHRPAHAIGVALTMLALLGAASGWTAEETTELAKKSQNPIADLISVPFQSNFNFGVGPKNVTQYLLNVQPVIPFKLTSEWNLITRTVLPIINQPSPADGIQSAFGLGDLNPSFFLSPAKPDALIWGVGPTFTLPTATDTSLGSGKWSLGPTAVALAIQGPWVFGALANQQWSFAGDSDRRSVSQLLVQPFLNYNFRDGWYLTSSPIITANWMADSGNKWTVPLGGGFGKVGLPVNTQLQAFYNVEKPHDAADWTLRFQLQFLLPK
ncbi:MAG: neuromedin [candidate division NC10 bacterium]|nr:neuromedin [candidate division NC10 bacterium]